jgi:alpha-1,2-mannosyltransferase
MQTELSHCDFMVDSSFPSTRPSTLEPDYMSQTKTWEKLSCKLFLDVASTGLVGRLGWVPDWDFIPSKYRRQWGEYCLLRRRSTSV